MEVIHSRLHERRRDGHTRLGAVAAIRRVVENRVESVVIFLRDRIVFVRVALGAHHGEAEPCGGRGRHPVLDRLGAIFLVVTAALVVRLGVAVKTSGDLLLQRGVWQQVACQLFDGELVERHVSVEGVNHPFPIRPHRTRQVHLIPVGIGVARQVQPATGEVFAEMVRGEQPINDLFVCLTALVTEEHIHLFDRWRQAGEIKTQPADQRGAIRLGRR